MRKCFDMEENITSRCWMGSGQRPSSGVLAPVILPADSRFILPAAAVYRPGAAGTRRQQGQLGLRGEAVTDAATRSEWKHAPWVLWPSCLPHLAASLPSVVIAALWGRRTPQRPSVHLGYFCYFLTFRQWRCRSSLWIIDVSKFAPKSTNQNKFLTMLNRSQTSRTHWPTGSSCLLSSWDFLFWNSCTKIR